MWGNTFFNKAAISSHEGHNLASVEPCGFPLAREQAPPPPDSAFVCFGPTLMFPFSSGVFLHCSQHLGMCSKRWSLQGGVRVASLSQTFGSHWPFLRLWAHSRFWLVAFHFCLVSWSELSPVSGPLQRCVCAPGWPACPLCSQTRSEHTGTFLPFMRACGLHVMPW